MLKDDEITVVCDKQGEPSNPSWRVCVGGGRVGETLQADFQKHLELVQHEMPFNYLRNHAVS